MVQEKIFSHLRGHVLEPLSASIFFSVKMAVRTGWLPRQHTLDLAITVAVLEGNPT